MSVICRTFVQNAWRSDLCSNCFKSLEDHSDNGGATRRNNVCEKLSVPRYVPQAATLYQSRGISTSLKWRLNESLYDRVSRRDIASQTPKNKTESESPPSSVVNGNRGILIRSEAASGEKKSSRNRPSVDFAPEEALVIGYGGNDYDSDTSPWEMGSDDGSIDFDLLDDTDEDRKITKLTKNNTEFNSFNKNLATAEDSPRKVKREEEKLNTINHNNNNNNNNNSVNISTKPADKTISILTYNDIQSTKTAEKKLNQYFFPSSTDIKSYLNGRGTSLIIEEAVVKNNNNNEKLIQALTGSVKVQNCTRRVPENGTPKVILEEDFTPLNTRTYSFVSELNKSNSVSFEQSSDSDYSTCRHTTGDSTDSESFHDVEESRLLPKSSFLHGTYTISPPAMHESDIDKKYDAGSSTSGDISNFSDDSDTHDPAPYKPRSTRVVEVKTSPAAGQNNRQEERSSKVHKGEEGLDAQKPEREAPKASNSEQQCQSSKSVNQKSRLSPPSSKHDSSSSSTDGDVKNSRSQAEDASPSKHSPHNTNKQTEAPKAVTKSSSMPNIPPSSEEVKKSPASKARELPEKQQQPVPSSAAVPQAVPDSRHQQQTPASKDSPVERNDGSSRELRDYDDTSDYDKSPDVIVNRQSKLAALALELEMARRDSEARAKKPPSPPTATNLTTPPEVKMRHSAPSNSTENYPTIKKASAISCASRLSTLPDVLQETPAKQKKTKFSLKKLLKRNKDSGTFSPANNKEVNPKAWKKQTFDRNRLSLEIVHPMDLTSDVPTSADSTPTEEHRQIVSTHPGKFTFKGVSSRARSLSALPQLSSDEQSGCALLECRKMDTVPTRKAGTVAERKKNRPSLVRTPSCSALPNRSTSTPASSDRTPPPKPPPPPKCKVMHPPPPLPPPHSHPRCSKTNNAAPSPARPPPPKIPDAKSRSHSSGSSAQELHEQNHSDKEYANLGDIRSLMTPKKPQRPSAFPSASTGRGGAMRKGSEDIYETLPADEEDHYTYLDEAEAKSSNKAIEVRGVESPPKGKPEPPHCGRPWLDLQTSYAAIAAANYESLAELITTSLNESAEYFRRVEQSLKWRDFVLESEEQPPPQHYPHIIKEKAVYSATYKSESQEKVTLVVAPRKQTTPQNARNQTRYPVLASFNDPIPKSLITNDNYILQESEMASIYILQRSRVTTVSDFSKASSEDLSNQYIHLRNYCFVLLQLIHTLKSLQAEGIEEINYDLQILVLVVTDEDRPPILVLFPEDKVQLTLCDISSRKTLCQATLETMLHFLQIGSIDDLKTCLVNGEQLADPVAHTFKAIAKVLSEEKASSLSQAKGFLEYMLWGPVDVKISQTDSEDVLDTILQRWLDLQRAQMVKSTISHLQNKKGLQVCLHVYEEYQLIFLLQASVKSLKNVVSKL